MLQKAQLDMTAVVSPEQLRPKWSQHSSKTQFRVWTVIKCLTQNKILIQIETVQRTLKFPFKHFPNLTQYPLLKMKMHKLLSRN